MRTSTVIRLHLRNPASTVALPFIIGGSALLVMIAIGLVLSSALGPEMADVYEGMIWNGAIWSALGPVLFFGAGAMTQYFPLALGLGLTRREFAVGSTVFFGAVAVIGALIVCVMQAIERATRGFGLQIRMFDVVYVGLGPLWQTFVQTALILVAAMFCGAALATVLTRFGQTAVWLVIGGLAIVGLIIMALLVGGPAGIADLVTGVPWGGWMAVLAAVGVMGAVSWFLLIRRASVR